MSQDVTELSVNYDKSAAKEGTYRCTVADWKGSCSEHCWQTHGHWPSSSLGNSVLRKISVSVFRFCRKIKILFPMGLEAKPFFCEVRYVIRQAFHPICYPLSYPGRLESLVDNTSIFGTDDVRNWFESHRNQNLHRRRRRSFEEVSYPTKRKTQS